MADESATQSSENLSRTMGLTAATAIGVGTMIGAGVFVFPGIAGGYAGPAAMLSFVIGGIVALLVALCTAELVTAMPKSGGGYYFVSRAFGRYFGFVAGVSQYLGLLFASAFYLSGFAEYIVALLNKLDIAFSSVLIAIGGALLLLGINIIGARKAGNVQNTVVVALTSILLLVFIYGVLDIYGINGEPKEAYAFAPNGFSSVLSTSALVFTSYLGFVQISTVAGEVKNPNRNLPVALISSVIIVILLYVFVLFVTTRLFSAETLSSFGETATLEVAKMLLGEWGALIVLFAAVLATLSSANASIMSSSRSLFALAKDHLVSEDLAKVNARFDTPHYALLLVVVPVAAMLFVNDLEFFAELASLLHLVLYAGICLSLIQFRRLEGTNLSPSFRLKGAYWIAIAGSLCCIFILCNLSVKTLLCGAGLLAATSLLYYLVVNKSTSTETEIQEEDRSHTKNQGECE